MSTAEDFLLIATDPVSGKPLISSPQADPVFGGAFLLDLVTAGRLTLEGEGRKARVIIANRAPVDDPLTELAFDRIRNRGMQKPQHVVTRLGKNGRKDLYESLATKGLVRSRQVKALGIFPLTRHDIIDTARRDDLLTRIRSALLHDQPTDAQTGPLIGLLSAADMVRIVVDKPDRKAAKAKAKVLAEGDWASEGVRKAIQAAQAAITAGVVAATSAAASGSS
ncbi:hypothetical protein J2X11_000080 [Aeromicrobium panaciterrae]|uniref:GPP34 family phosphoprotein n=1 Tax=Aeromicrobium panaciterrae TaxID=363861 RepID=A0ABU1UJ96_9ACTN|nr:GPP34 family phosphoprotein [Aeromicrobium panaciterrae]MDR7085241.1 hypothetical protein [Aeromicrobium panaciterrae]